MFVQCRKSGGICIKPPFRINITSVTRQARDVVEAIPRSMNPDPNSVPATDSMLRSMTCFICTELFHLKTKYRQTFLIRVLQYF